MVMYNRDILDKVSKLETKSLQFYAGIQNCQQNLNIDGGSVTYSAIPSITGSTASFVCDNGNDPIGESTLTCETSGRNSMWSGDPSTCEHS